VNASDTVILDADGLTNFATALLQAADVDGDEALVVARSLVLSNLCGHDSHGVVRIPDYIEQLKNGELRAGTELTITSETPGLVVADAGFGFGQVQSGRLIDQIAVKATAQGIACGTMINCGHVGRLGEWVERAAADGFAALMAVNDNGVLQCVAPPGGIEPRISTNPIAIGVPTGGDPLVLDISTSCVANGKVFVQHMAGRPCPPGWLLDENGQPTTDPSVRFSEPKGTILPMGGEQGFKGFGLGLLFDILVGGLSGGFCPPKRDTARMTNNVVMLLWDPAHFSGKQHFGCQADDLIEYVRQTKLIDGVDAIRLPNDRSATSRIERLKSGIPLGSGTWRALTDLATNLHIHPPTEIRS